MRVMAVRWLSGGLVVGMLAAAAVPVASEFPFLAGTCTGSLTLTFAPPWGGVDQAGAVEVSGAWTVCTAAGPFCNPAFQWLVCECPLGAGEGPCAAAGSGPQELLTVPYFGNCVRAFVGGGWVQILGSSLVTGLMLNLNLDNPAESGVGTLEGAPVPTAGTTCALAQATCHCTLGAAGRIFG